MYLDSDRGTQVLFVSKCRVSMGHPAVLITLPFRVHLDVHYDLRLYAHPRVADDDIRLYVRDSALYLRHLVADRGIPHLLESTRQYVSFNTGHTWFRSD